MYEPFDVWTSRMPVTWCLFLWTRMMYEHSSGEGGLGQEGMQERQLFTSVDLLLRCPSVIWCCTQDVKPDICEVYSRPWLYPMDESRGEEGSLKGMGVCTSNHSQKAVWRQNMRTWWCLSQVIVSCPSKCSICHEDQRIVLSSVLEMLPDNRALQIILE